MTIACKCRTCWNWISEFSPNKSYCSKTCEDNWDWKDSQVEYLKNMFWMN